MIQDYIGQDLIWNLKGINPYKVNNLHYSITYRCKSEEENNAIKDFVCKHLKPEEIVDIVMEDSPFSIGQVVKEIQVRNVFGLVNEVRIINLG